MNNEEFYSKINPRIFNMGIKMVSGDTLANLVRILVTSRMGNFRSINSPAETRELMTYAAKILVEQMILDMKESYKDIDDFMATGQLPEYLKDMPEPIKELFRRAAKKAGNEFRT